MPRGLPRSLGSCQTIEDQCLYSPHTPRSARDDHLPLNTIAKIPTADVIDFDYPRPMLHGNGYWHTEQDTPDKCSGQSLAAVAAVMYEWLKYRSGVIK